jgi:hypothetical protein
MAEDTANSPQPQKPLPSKRPSRPSMLDMLPENTLWLRHLTPSDHVDEIDDTLRMQLETPLGWIINFLHDKMPTEAATQHAEKLGAVMLTDAALSLLREHAPDQYQSMVASLMAHDPAFTPIRELLGNEGERRGEMEAIHMIQNKLPHILNFRFYQGFMLGLTIALLAYLILFF